MFIIGGGQKFFEFVQKHKSFIVKPYNGHSGQGIHICTDILNKDIEKLFAEELSNGAFVVEELIRQGEAVARLHPQSINTLRIMTFKVKNEITVIGAALRMGTGGSSVDNAGAGGIYANIDTERGFINTIARDNLGTLHSVHPDTNIKIPGFEIPEWNNAIVMVKSMASVVENATMISWDLAYTDQGWVMVEGNDVGEPYLLQALCQKGIKNKIITLIDKYFQAK